MFYVHINKYTYVMYMYDAAARATVDGGCCPWMRRGDADDDGDNDYDYGGDDALDGDGDCQDDDDTNWVFCMCGRHRRSDCGICINEG